jgi:hypothetical protein
MATDHAFELFTSAGIIGQLHTGKRKRVFEASEDLKELEQL